MAELTLAQILGLIPPPKPAGERTPLSQVPLEQTNPNLARLRDFTQGLLGLKQEPGQTPSGYGAMLSAVLPLMAAAKGAPAAIRAFHGSPHDFEKFSLSKIGTGEGAQAYGHGLYFAEQERIAKGYRDALAGNNLDSRNYWIGDQNADISAVTSKAAQVAAKAGKIPESRAYTIVSNIFDTLEDMNGAPASDFLKHYQVESDAEAYKAASKELGSLHYRKNEGKLYEVSINASPDEFLDWDKPLSQQSEKVQKAVEQSGMITYRGTRANEPGHTTEIGGRDIYEHFSKKPDEFGTHTNMAGQQVQAWTESRDSAAATEALRKAGIKGIRYLDQGSRGPSVIYDVGSPRKDFGPYSPYTNKADADKQLALLKQHGFQDAEIKVKEQPSTSNYVVFDDAIIDIMKKYGIALPAAALMQQYLKQNPPAKGKKSGA